MVYSFNKSTLVNPRNFSATTFSLIFFIEKNFELFFLISLVEFDPFSSKNFGFYSIDIFYSGLLLLFNAAVSSL